MKIDRITLSRVHGLLNFSNVKIEIQAIVNPDESPEEAFDKAHTFLRAHLRIMVDKADGVYQEDPDRMCANCGKTYHKTDYKGDDWVVCPHCGSRDTRNLPAR